MSKILGILILLFLSSVIFSEDIANKWNSLIKECELALIDGEMEKARSIAIELNAIDPADTHVMFYMVLTHKALNLPIPKYLVEQPWPNATEQDKENYRRAMAVINGT